VYLSSHVGNCVEEDAVRVDRTLLVRGSTGEDLMFDEVFCEPILWVLEVLVGEHLSGERDDRL
jgi:hypothetical protein